MPYPTQHENFYKNQVIQLQFQLEHLIETYNNRIDDRIISEGILGRLISAAAGGVEQAAIRVGQKFPSAAAQAAAAAAEAERQAMLAWKRLVKPMMHRGREVSGPDLAAWLLTLSPSELTAYYYKYSEAREFVFLGQTYIQRLFDGRVQTWDSVNNIWREDMWHYLAGMGSGRIPSAFGDHNMINIPLRVPKYVEPNIIDTVTLTPRDPNATTIGN